MPISRSNSRTLALMLFATAVAYVTLGFIANSELGIRPVHAQDMGRYIGRM
jgi:hypothetical protein